MAPSTEAFDAAKPGTACLCCRRRKLKCTREPGGCASCVKADLPCVYPTPDTTVKRKRGPYKKKDRPAREAHLEHVVKYLSDPVAQADSSPLGSEDTVESPASSASRPSVTLRPNRSTTSREHEPDATSEQLVKDALIALTNTFVSRSEQASDEPTSTGLNATNGSSTTFAPDESFTHPTFRHAIELWQIFTTRVDPLTKIINCRAFAPKLIAFLDKPEPGAMSTLACSIFYTSLMSCLAEEVQERFGESKATLVRKYGLAVETSIAQNYSKPSVELMQALLLYLVCLRRHESESGLWALFSLAVRNAQLMGLNEDPGTRFCPYESEMRRRLWWTICSLESRCAEEGAAKNTAIMATTTVQLPANINDDDLMPDAGEIPRSREGITAMSLPLIRWEMMRISCRIWALKKHVETHAGPLSAEEVRKRQEEEFEQSKTHIEFRYLRHCDQSRPLDWFIIGVAEIMMNKNRLFIDYPWDQTTTKSMSLSQRSDLLSSSVVIVRYTHQLTHDPKCADWLWFFRNFTQWHSLAIVLAETANSTNVALVKTAWTVIRPLLKTWDRVYRDKKHVATWDHVNSLIQRAKMIVDQTALADQRECDGRQNSEDWQSDAASMLHFEANVSNTRPRLSDNIQSSTQAPKARDLPFPQFSGTLFGLPHEDVNMDTLQDHRSRMQPAMVPTGTPPTNLDSSYIPELVPDIGDFDIPDEIDLEALNAVFGSSSWDTAVSMDWT